VMERLQPGRTSVVFHSASGPLTVTRKIGAYVMDFPARPSEQVAIPPGMAEALGATPREVYVNSFNYMAVLDGPEVVRSLEPAMAGIAKLGRGGVIVTAPGDGHYDFVSRYFAPAKGIPEDPVTGSAHCTLAPYWARRLGKTSFQAFQASRRGGEVGCRLHGERVELEGACVFYLEGSAEI
jgi:predicted PhzF superfamily epimerase YddE/YHI9